MCFTPDEVQSVQVCLADLRTVQQHEPQSIDAADLMQRLNSSWAKSRKADTALYGEMLGRSNASNS